MNGKGIIGSPEWGLFDYWPLILLAGIALAGVWYIIHRIRREVGHHIPTYRPIREAPRLLSCEEAIEEIARRR